MYRIFFPYSNIALGLEYKILASTESTVAFFYFSVSQKV
jgi:hypothetical protein